MRIMGHVRRSRPTRRGVTGTLGPRHRTLRTASALVAVVALGLALPPVAGAQVVDSTPPHLELPDGIVAEATRSDGAVVDYEVLAVDDVDGPITPICAPPSGSRFTIGDRTVSCSATDWAHNTTTGTFLVTVQDTTPPTIAGLPTSELVLVADSSGHAQLALPPLTATDAVDGTVEVSCHPGSGSWLTIGSHQVDCRAFDTAGNMALERLTVEVVDDAPPTLTVPDDIVVEATGPDGAEVSPGEVTATDDLDDDVDVVCTPVPERLGVGEVFEVTCTATDDAGNATEDSYRIAVVDTTPPDLVLSDDRVVEGNTLGGAFAFVFASAVDVVDGPVLTECDGPVVFPLGETIVTCSAVDTSDNVATGTSRVEVVDTRGPGAQLTQALITEATGPNGAPFDHRIERGFDVVFGWVPVTCTPASGATFPLGTTSVRCEGTDPLGNHGSFVPLIFRVVDTTPPEVTVPDMVSVAPTGPDGADAGTVVIEASATDLVSGDVPVDCDLPPGVLPFGDTLVTCSATDEAGNTAMGDVVVRVEGFVRVGFHRPVQTFDAADPVVNVAKAGSTVPMKFELFAAGGVEVTSTDAVAGIFPVSISCASGVQEDTVELLSSGPTGLRYDAEAGQFVFNFTTPRQRGTCWEVSVDLADGGSITARFRLR